jgi:hypothetical protein
MDLRFDESSRNERPIETNIGVLASRNILSSLIYRARGGGSLTGIINSFLDTCQVKLFKRGSESKSIPPSCTKLEVKKASAFSETCTL